MAPITRRPFVHRLPMEAAHVRMLKRGVKQVSLVGCKDDNKIQYVRSKYLFSDPGNNYVGYCAMECCDSKTEEFCYEYDDGYSNPHTNQYCKAIADGGCPCPGDQVRCGADLEMNITGWCTDICCNSNTEEQCYDPPSCAPIVDGGCSCPAGQERCGANLALNYTGWCTDVCCDQITEEFCYNYTGCLSNQYCAAIADGGCPCPEGNARCGADPDNNILGWCTIFVATQPRKKPAMIG